ncbi:MAG: DUF7594 domain-containing protein [Acidimicrobiia bacterium]
MATGLQVAAATPDGSVDIGAAGVTTVTLNPEADATVSASRPDTNFGRGGVLQVHGKPRLDSYLRFSVPAGATGRAVLRLWVLNSTTNGPRIRPYDGPMNGAAVTWDSRPTPLVGTPVDSGPLQAGSWAEWDVTGFVTGPGDIALAAVADSTDGVEFGSRESDHSPQLVIATAPTPPTASSKMPSPTPPTASSTMPSPTPTGPARRVSPTCRPDWAPAQPMAQLKDGLGEMSAFVASPNHPGWGWGIRDSGQPASLYAIKPASEGTVPAQEFPAYGLHNSDWEDMAWTPGQAPGTGHLWVLENVGNGWTGNRWIYQFEELDPELDPGNPPAPPAVAPAPPPPTPAKQVGAYEWAYPDAQVNTETMFVFNGDLVVVTKTEPSRVYRFDHPLVQSVVNVPTYVGTLPVGDLLSVAALSADQRTLAVSNHGKLDVYENRGDVHDLAALISNPVVHHDMPADNREGGSFFPYGSCDLLLVAESKTVWRLEHR